MLGPEEDPHTLLSCKCMKPCGSLIDTYIEIADCKSFGNNAGTLICEDISVRVTALDAHL